MARHPLEGCYAKLALIDEGVEALCAQVSAYLPTACKVGYKEYHDEGKVECLILKHEEPPASISAKAGSILYDARSCLDQLVYEMIKLSGATPTDRSEFPIFLDRQGFPKLKDKKVAGLTAKQLSHIEALQPYHQPNPKEHLLWALHQLNNIDKHRQIHVCEAMMGGIVVEANFSNAITFRLPEDASRRIYEGKIIGTWEDIVFPFVSDLHSKVDAVPKGLVFGPRSAPATDREVLHVLAMIRNFIVNHVLVSPGCADGFTPYEPEGLRKWLLVKDGEGRITYDQHLVQPGPISSGP